MYRNRKSEQNVFSFYESLPKGIRKFPFDIRKAILTLGNCTVYSYQEVVEQNNISIAEVIIFCGSDTGCTVKRDANYIIMFNDALSIPRGRKRFTLAHELGHILLEHMIFLESVGVYNSSYSDEQFERNADCFAACILCPMPILSQIKPKTAFSLQMIFGVSLQAAEILLYDYKSYNKHHDTEWHDNILSLFSSELNSLRSSTYRLDCIHETEETRSFRPKINTQPEEERPLDSYDRIQLKWLEKHEAAQKQPAKQDDETDKCITLRFSKTVRYYIGGESKEKSWEITK